MRWAGCLTGCVVVALLGCGVDDGPDGGGEVELASGSLSTLTYNVHGLPSAITGDDTAARLEQIGPLLNGFDLVGLQEDFIDANHDGLEEASAHLTQVRFAELFDPTRVYGSGLTLFADAPEVERNHQHYGTCHGFLDSASDCLASKGLQVVRLALAEGLEVDVYNTHLEAGGGEEDDAVRAQQVALVVETLVGWSDQRAVIFTGDFNLHAGDPQDAPLLELLFVDGQLLDACAELDCPEPNHIDKVLFRSSVDLEIAAETWQVEEGFVDAEGLDLSDHPAISVDLSWRALP